jgi:hypothetical protein
MADERPPRDVLPLREYARMSARLVVFGRDDRARLLDKLGVAPALAQASDSYWLERLSADADDPAAPVAQEFAGAFMAERRRLLESGASIESLEPIVAVAPAQFAPRDETAFAPAVRIDDATLPFAPAVDARPPAPVAAGVAPEAGATGLLPVVSSGGAPALPFSATTRPDDALRAAFPLVRWASLCAELLVRPRDRPSVLARYQLAGEPEYARLEGAWAEHLARSPAEREEWQRLVATYRDVLTGKRSAP